MQQLYYLLYDAVEEGEKHVGYPNQIETITDQIVELQNQLYDFEDKEQKTGREYLKYISDYNKP
jgi:site-specific DNA recombinase